MKNGANYEKCERLLYDQDDGEKSYCQLPKGHKIRGQNKIDHSAWPSFSQIQKAVESYERMD